MYRRTFIMTLKIPLVVCVLAVATVSVRGDLTLSGSEIPAGGVHVPLEGALQADSGTISVRFLLPDDWPGSDRGTLFHIGEEAHFHVTLFTNSGRLTAVYKGGEDHYAAINYSGAADWQGGSLHEATFSWNSNGNAVDLYLEVDGQLRGRQTGNLIQDWPQHGYIGIKRNAQKWRGTVEAVALSPVFTYPRELRDGERTITVDGKSTGRVLHNFWSINNYTSQHMWEDPAYPEQAKRDKPFMQQVNCVRLLGGRHDGLNNWYQGIADDGSVVGDFSGMIRYLGGILEAGYTPRIVLDNIPTAMSVPGELAKYGNTLPAKDLKVWHAYVKQAVQSMVDAFGSETVSTWRIRVGTEPDLYPGHWKGSKEQYLQHYDCTVDAVLSVLPNAEIGPGNILNPAKREPVKGTGQPPWGLDIVDHCARGTNTWTGGTGTPIHFLECSWYGQVGESIDSFDVAIQRMRERLARYPELSELPVSVSEFSILNDENNVRCYGDITEWGASWYAAVADRVYSLGVDQVHEWAQATGGILHPRTHVIGMLEEMAGGEIMDVSIVSNSMANAGAIACRKEGKTYILLYNHRPWRAPSIPEKINLVLKADGSGTATWSVREWRIDRNHGVFAHAFYEDCSREGLATLPGSPMYGGNVQLRYGPGAGTVLTGNRDRYTMLGKPVLVRDGETVITSADKIELVLEMPGHSVSLLEMSPVD